MNGLVGAKNRGGGHAKLRKREKTNGLEGAKNRGAGWANLRRKKKTNGLIGANNRVGESQPKE